MEAFKNIYNKTEIQRLAQEIFSVYKEFDQKEFLDSLLNSSWEHKEMKERIRAISTKLGEFLPKEYSKALEILMKIDRKFQNLFHLIFPDFVEVYGIEDYERSLNALKHFTSNSSSEFAIRAFIIEYPQTIEILKQWTEDENQHVRRLASEGSRPRLPWGVDLKRYKRDPSTVIELLERLKDDSSEYVRKSVANNLNDISKDNPAMAKEVFFRWFGENKLRDKIVKHGARTLLKTGDVEVLELFGFSSLGIEIEAFNLSSSVKLGESLHFSFKIKAQKSLGKLRIEYRVGLVRQKGKMGSKVFKISEREVQENELRVERSHSFKVVTTRAYYKGVHTITPIINGKEFMTKEFFLEV